MLFIQNHQFLRNFQNISKKLQKISSNQAFIEVLFFHNSRIMIIKNLAKINSFDKN